MEGRDSDRGLKKRRGQAILGQAVDIKMFDTYVIKSVMTGKYYIGSSQDLRERVRRHNAGYTKSLQNKGPFELIYVEKYSTKAEVYRRERQIKSYKGGEAFKKLIKYNS